MYDVQIPQIIIHRVNTLEKLRQIPENYGVEFDVRTYKDKIILQHELFSDGELFEDFLDEVGDRFLLIDIKEEWLSRYLKPILAKKSKTNYLFLNASIPEIIVEGINKNNKSYILRSNNLENKVVPNDYSHFFKAIWVDTYFDMGLSRNKHNVLSLKGLKIIYTAPDIFYDGRPNDYKHYMDWFNSEGFKPDSICTTLNSAKIWENFLR